MSDTAAFSDLTRHERDSVIASIVACGTARGLFDENGEISGQFNCPKCDRPVAYAVAESNGHTRGRCTTKGCVQWVE